MMDVQYSAKMYGFSNTTQKVSITDLHGSKDNSFSEESALSLLIILGSSLSLVGLVFAFITYSLFSDLRNLSGTTLMNLLAALFMTQLLYVIGVGGIPDSEFCIVLAFSLQYIRLSVLCWMLCMARHMYQQFRNNVNLQPPVETSVSKNFFRYSLFSWGLPALFLSASVIVQYKDKAGKLWDTKSLMDFNCWFLDKNAHIYGLLVPSTILVFAIFLHLLQAVVVSRYVISMQVERRAKEKMRRKRTLQVLLFGKLTLLLAAVLALGACAKLHKTTTTWITFNISQSLQGILVAMLVTCNCQVLKMYTWSIKSKSTRLITTTTNGPAASLMGNAADVTKTTSLQMLTWEPVPDTV